MAARVTWIGLGAWWISFRKIFLEGGRLKVRVGLSRMCSICLKWMYHNH